MINNKKQQKRYIAKMFLDNMKKHLAASNNEIENKNNYKDKIMEPNEIKTVEQEFIIKISDQGGCEKEIKLKSNLTFDEVIKIAEKNLLNESLSKVAVLQLQDKLTNGVELVEKFKEALTLFPILIDVTNELEEARNNNLEMQKQIQTMKYKLKEKFGFDDSDFESEADNG